MSKKLFILLLSLIVVPTWAQQSKIKAPQWSQAGKQIQEDFSKFTEQVTLMAKATQTALIPVTDTIAEHLPETIEHEKKTLIDWLPNSISFVPAQHQHAEFSYYTIPIDDGPSKLFLNDSSRLKLFKGISVERIYRPKKYWSWNLSFSPAFSYVHFNRNADMKMLHLSAGMSLLWHMPRYFGTFRFKIGAGPFVVDGIMNTIEEKRKWGFAPLLQGSYYNFISDNVYLELKNKFTYIFSSRYFRYEVENEFSYLESINLLSLAVGYNF